MAAGIDKDCIALGDLFQTIISDMRKSTPIWEDFSNKATKLNSVLKTTQVATATFLDAFQKVADMATGSRGATKEMGSALTRLCMRHRSIETKLKTLATSITENLVSPLQEKMEEWKRTVAQMDKDHAKEYKKASLEIKKAESDTIRLKKKVKKGKSDIHNRLANALQDVDDKYFVLAEIERNAVRSALIEERSQFCMFVTCFKPFVDWEISLLTEITHLKEVMDNLSKQSTDPHMLPPASEQVILDLKGQDVWSFQPSPSSPISLGSRKSSMCSISSINSSSSGSTKSHSPTHQFRYRTSSHQQHPGTVRLTSVSSQDSGFTSQDTLFLRPVTPPFLKLRQTSDNIASTGTETPETDSTPSTPSENTPSASSTWNNWPNPPHVYNSEQHRPHTISSAYEKTHSRPPLSEQLFKPPSQDRLDQVIRSNDPSKPHHKQERPKSAINATSPYARPSATINKMQPVLPPLGPKPKSKAVPPPTVPAISRGRLMSFLSRGGQQPTYVNMTDLAHMAAEKQRKQEQQKERGSKLLTQNQSPMGSSQSLLDLLDIQEAIRDLENCTAALHSDYDTDSDSMSQKSSDQMQQNLELAKAIKELEASTAALESAYEEPSSNASRSSLQCSSGYGTMNSTPASSEDTIASGDIDLTPTEGTSDSDKYFTIPLNSDMCSYKATVASKRPASTAGIPISQPAGSGSRRPSQSKPPPPVRRTSSVSTPTPPAVLQKIRSSPVKQSTPSQQMHGSPAVQKRSHSQSQQRASSNIIYSQPNPMILRDIASGDASSHYAKQGPPHATVVVEYDKLSVLQTTGSDPHLQLSAGRASVIETLNAKFSALQTQPQEVPQTVKEETEDDMEKGFPLPPPPTEEELAAMGVACNNAPMDSVLLEMKCGPKLRKISVSESSEC